MKIIFTVAMIKQLEKIKKKNPALSKRIQHQVKLFIKDPTYPSLRNHKLTGKLARDWSISVEQDLRMLYFFDKVGRAVFFAIGTHDEMYRKNR